MSILDKLYARHREHNPIDLAQERAEDAADTAQSTLQRDFDAIVAKHCAEALRAMQQVYEDAQDLKHLPIGITREQAKRKGWVA